MNLEVKIPMAQREIGNLAKALSIVRHIRKVYFRKKMLGKQ